jgi:hypothetical protein
VLPDDLASLESRAQIMLYSEAWFPFPADARAATPAERARIASAVKLRLDYAPSGATFEGCTPATPSTVLKQALFCEDVYDITAKGEAEFSDKGMSTAWKFLLPVGPRIIEGAERSGGSLYVKVVFPTTGRDELAVEIEKILGSVEVR